MERRNESDKEEVNEMKGILVLLIVIFGSLSITFSAGKEIGVVTASGILISFVMLIAILYVTVREGTKVSYAVAGTEPTTVCRCVIVEGELIDDSDCILHNNSDGTFVG